MVPGETPKIWFEREIVAEAMHDVAAQVEVLGRGLDAAASDPYASLALAQAVVMGVEPVNAAFLDQAPNLRVIARTGIGVDSVDIPEATRRGIAVVNAPDAPTVSTAEHTMALLFAATKDLARAQRRLASGEGNLFVTHDGLELFGKTLGVVGLGRIGRRVATMASAVGMEVVAHDPYVDPSHWLPSVERVDDLDSLLERADVLVLHTPLTDETRHLIDAASIAKMKPGAFLINTSRGGVVDLDAVLDALDSGHLRRAAVDVTEPEPLPPGHRAFGRDDLIVTPHVAPGTTEGRYRNFMHAFAQIVPALNGERPKHLVNPSVWPLSA